MQRVAIIHHDEFQMNCLEGELSEDFNVSRYFDGRSFLRNLRYNRPDLIVLDAEISDVRSEAIIEQVRKVGVRIPVIVHASGIGWWEKLNDETVEWVDKGKGSLRFACRIARIHLWRARQGRLPKARSFIKRIIQIG